MRSRRRTTLSEIDILPLWRGGHRFIPNGFRVKADERADGPHWQGGTPRHQGTTCATCGRDLQLIWDFNLTAPELCGVRPFFGGLDRITLYYCMNCPAANVYQLQDGTRLRCFDPGPDNGSGEESPFREPPDELPRRSILLERIPSVLEGLLAFADDADVESLDGDARRMLNDYLGSKIDSMWDLQFSQFGGQPILAQSHQEIVCPNPDCPAHSIEHPYAERERRFLMKELAVVEDDVKLAAEPFYAQIAFHICCVCRVVHAQYRCS